MVNYRKESKLRNTTGGFLIFDTFKLMNMEVDLSSEIRRQFDSTDKLRSVNYFFNSNISLRQFAKRKRISHSMLSKWVKPKAKFERQNKK